MRTLRDLHLVEWQSVLASFLPVAASVGCLSLDGVRKTKRYKDIEVKFLNENFEEQRQKFSGFIAQNIQHQCDHLEGIII